MRILSSWLSCDKSTLNLLSFFLVDDLSVADALGDLALDFLEEALFFKSVGNLREDHFVGFMLHLHPFVQLFEGLAVPVY